MKICSSCKENKELLDFPKDCTRLDGYNYYCKLCIETKGYKQKYKKSVKGKLANQKYQRNNKGTVNAKTVKRRAKKLLAIPNWLTNKHLEEIKQFYIICPIGYEVDHIIPLQGKNVSGLHVPWNLQIIPLSKNRSKGNRLGS